MSVKVFRRGSARCFGLVSAFVTILLCLYYIAKEPSVSILSNVNSSSKSSSISSGGSASDSGKDRVSSGSISGSSSNNDINGIDGSSGISSSIIPRSYNGSLDNMYSKNQNNQNEIYDYKNTKANVIDIMQTNNNNNDVDNEGGSIDGGERGGRYEGRKVKTIITDKGQQNKEGLQQPLQQEQHPKQVSKQQSLSVSLTQINNIRGTGTVPSTSINAAADAVMPDRHLPSYNINNPMSVHGIDKCYNLDESHTDITALEEYIKFDFQPEWIRTKEYWDRGFEERFETQKNNKQRPPLKVIIVPHSHNDPGWQKPFLNYFQSDTRQILNNMVTKMQEFKDMTFMWTEISFLQLWWDQAHPTKQRALKRLINSGRFEITTGGWVMTDEADVHLYAMLDQLIEGHQWVKNNLNVTPTVGWSIDPFGHGSTVPYLLSGSNFEGAIIQRIHYAWKEWFARQMKSDFIWVPYWQERYKEATSHEHQKGRLLTHNMPFDIYSIKGSCGPHPFICLNFDFRKIPGEYTEYSVRAQFITDENVEEKAQLLLEQYARTASLFPHNVALIPVGDDFRYNQEREVNQQYTNYKKLIDHIMANKRLYNVDIGFGTPKDYFREIRKRSQYFSTFKGDFFVYSDIFSEGRPAYWSGYYTTRPFYKIMSTDLEHNLRAAEILFTVAYNTARQKRLDNAIKIFEKNYEKIIHARRNLGLFQHHDAITGTSKAAVMRDYGLRLFESIQDTIRMQVSSIELLLQNGSMQHDFLLSDLERDSFNKLPRKTPIPLSINSQNGHFTIEMNNPSETNDYDNNSSFVVFNPSAQKRIDVLIVRTPTAKVKLINEFGVEIKKFQINPVWNIIDTTQDSDDDDNGDDIDDKIGTTDHIRPSKFIYEILFLAELEPLSLTTYHVVRDGTNYKNFMSIIYCDSCGNHLYKNSGTQKPNNEQNNKESEARDFIIKKRPAGDIQLENGQMRLLFNEKTGFLTSITRKFAPKHQQRRHLKTQPHQKSQQQQQQEYLMKSMPCSIKFAAYRSAQFHSGAYLFKTDPDQTEAEKDVLDQYQDVRIIITSGEIASEVTVLYGSFLAHTVRLYNTHTLLDAGIFIKNDIDFEPPPKNRETELFMRFSTNIDNVAAIDKNLLKVGETIRELPQLFTDQNGFQYHRRLKVPSIGIEGNYYPITTMAFMQDEKVRFSLLTTHAQGAASYEPGQLEVMLDRRTLYDDYRGMGEGVVDSRLTRHRFWILIEDIISRSNTYQVPSLLANYLANGLRYPSNIYFVENFERPQQLKTKVNLLQTTQWPCDIHLLNLRTLSEEQLQLFPSSSALMILHRQGYDCSVISKLIDMSRICPPAQISPTGRLGYTSFNNLHMSSLESTSLTGITSDQGNRKRLKSFSDIILKPMELLTFNVTFRN